MKSIKQNTYLDNYVLIPKYYFPIMGGLQNATIRLADNLVSRGKRVSILCIKPYNNAVTLNNPVNHDNINVNQFNCNRENFWNNVKREIMKQNQLTCYIALGLEYPEYLDAQIEALILAKENGHHTGIRIATTGDFINRITKQHAMSLKKLNGIIVLNDKMQEEVASFECLTNISKLIPVMIDNKLYKPLMNTAKLRWKKHYNLPLDSFVMLWNGRIAERKRPLDVIMSWANAGISGILWFVGNDENMSKPNEQLLLRRIKEKKLTNVVIRKAVPESSMRYIYGCADAFITASSVEGMSNSMMEASSVGLPIIGYNIPGNIDIAKMFNRIGFYLCDFADTANLANCITQVYKTFPLNYREEREKYLSQVEPSAIVTKYLDLIAKV